MNILIKCCTAPCWKYMYYSGSSFNVSFFSHLFKVTALVPAVSNPGSVPAQSFIIYKFIASVVQNVK